MTNSDSCRAVRLSPRRCREVACDAFALGLRGVRFPRGGTMVTKDGKGWPVGSCGKKQRPATPQRNARAAATVDPGARPQATRVALPGPMAAGIAHELNDLLTIVL